MVVPAPSADTRWRCALCGNLTRFDVQRTTRAREYVHVSLAGEPAVEEREVLADTLERVTCRWCGRADSVELVPRPAAGRATAGRAIAGRAGSGPVPSGPGSAAS